MSVLALTACGGGARSGTVPSGTIPKTTGTVARSDVARSDATETARSADAFVDFVGVNVHLGYYGTFYGDNFTAVDTLLANLGVRHVRDGIYPGQANLCANFRQLASQGIHGDFMVSDWMNQADVTAWDACTSQTADAYEGLNEWDMAHPATDQNWAQTDASVQQWLYSTVKSTRSVTVVAPALTSESTYATVGSLSAVSDVGNTHVYFAGRNPGTSGWGGGGPFGVYGALGYDVAIARQPTGGKDMYATESGYGDAPGTQYAVPRGTKARYLLRDLLEHWNAGVARVYLYELVDEGGGDFSSYGLTDAGGTPKPAYVAVKNLLAHLRDPGAAGAPASLSYSLTAPSNLHHALFQKHDGSFVLALWLEVPEWDPAANSPVAVTPQPVTASFANAPSSAQTTTFDDAGNVSTQPTAVNGNSLSLDVGGSPILLDIKP